MSSKGDRLKNREILPPSKDDKLERFLKARKLEAEELKKAGGSVSDKQETSVSVTEHSAPKKAVSVGLIDGEKFGGLSVSLETKTRIDEIVETLGISKVNFLKIVSGYEGE